MNQIYRRLPSIIILLLMFWLILLPAQYADCAQNDRIIHVPTLTFTGRGFTPQSIDAGTLSFTGRGFTPQSIDAGTLSFTGQRQEAGYDTGSIQKHLSRTATHVTLLQVRSLIAAAQGTNPFDYKEVQEDVEEAQQVPAINPAPAATPAANPYPVALTATFMGPYMAFPGDSIYLPVEEGGAGTNTLGDFTTSPGAGTALRIENQFDTMLNSFVGFFANTGWSIISQSVPNPVPDVDVSLIVRRNSDNNYFKVTLNLYGSASAVDVFTLSGFNCGPDQADCP